MNDLERDAAALDAEAATNRAYALGLQAGSLSLSAGAPPYDDDSPEGAAWLRGVAAAHDNAWASANRRIKAYKEAPMPASAAGDLTTWGTGLNYAQRELTRIQIKQRNERASDRRRN